MNSGVLHGFVASNVSDNLLTFAHISDLHNDPTNYTRFLNLLNEHDEIIDFGVVSGDLVDSGSSANFAEMVGCESVLNGNVPVYKCMGNHETGMTLANIYTAYQPGSGDGNLYFFKDFSTQKIRVIFLNQYDNESSTRGNTGHYSQTQIDWFISQLSDAITNDLSVIVVLHSMGEAGWPLYNKHGFYQQVLGDMYGAVNSAPIISDIINAFKHKKTLNKTYTYTDGDGSLNVNVTFSGYGKFICYIAGHEHVDVIGYSQIYPDQLICLVQGGVVTSSTRTEAQAHWQSKYDTPRVANTVTSDSINVYSIDTVQKLVKVVKVGSTVTDKFETRSFAVFGY
jgi:3',5'-cyclic AMP phosphodiesterase CpdA